MGMADEDLQFKIGEDESPATVEINEVETDDGVKMEAQLVDNEAAPTQQDQDQQLEQYSDKVKKRIDKMTARLREAERREQAALEFARGVQQQASQMQAHLAQTDNARWGEARSRIETQMVALKQIIRKAREEGDVDTETEAQQRLTALTYEQHRVQDTEAQRQQYFAQQQAMAQQAQAQPAQQPAVRPTLDPRAEQWAEDNPWFGKDMVMTHATWGIHRQLIQVERFDPNSDEYYDELNRRVRDAFPQKFSAAQGNRATRSVQTVAPASRSSGVNNVRRSVRLTPSQVAIAKKLGVPLEEYAKYVKE
jgi:hypothetical protein